MKKIIAFLILTVCFSCKSKWTEKNKSDFLGGCIENTIQGMGSDKAKAYCKCLLEKVVAKYPNANDAQYAKYDTSLITVSKECLKQP